MGGAALVQELSNLRTSAGFWSPSDALFELLFSKRPSLIHKVEEFEKLAGTTDNDAFATIMVLSFLNKHANSEKAVWQGMWNKAMKFLEVGVFSNNLIANIDFPMLHAFAYLLHNDSLRPDEACKREQPLVLWKV